MNLPEPIPKIRVARIKRRIARDERSRMRIDSPVSRDPRAFGICHNIVCHGHEYFVLTILLAQDMIMGLLLELAGRFTQKIAGVFA